MIRYLFLALLLACTPACAVSIWNSTAVDPVLETYRIPVDVSSSGGPSHITPLTLKSYIETNPDGISIYGDGSDPGYLRIFGVYTGPGTANYMQFVTNQAADWMVIKAGGTGDIGFALQPQGGGALAAQVPDSASTGGNVRGYNAVDWQVSRTDATMVADGSFSVIGGGQNNTAAGEHTVVAGGGNNSTGGDGYATVSGGAYNTASGGYSTVSGGVSNTASGSNSHVSGGQSNTASSSSSTVSGGSYNVADGAGAWIPGGTYGHTRGLTGAGAYASGQRSAAGDAQVILQPVSRTTTNATPVSLATDGTPAATTVMVLPAESVSSCAATVAAMNDASGTVSMAGFTANAIVKNDSSTITVSGGTCVAVGTPDAALATATCALVGNGTLDSLELQATGVAATTIYWVSEIKCVQAL